MISATVDSRDDRALRVLLGLLLGQAALAQQLLDQRVVLGDPLELAVAQAVGAAVAHVGEGDLSAPDVGGGQRRPHAGAARVGLRELVDLGVGRVHGARQAPLGALRLLAG